MTIVHKFGLLGASLAVAACSTAPDPILYTLGDQPQLRRSDRSQSIIGLSEVILPAYARNAQITTEVSAHRVVEDDDHRWAVPPAEAITSALVTILETTTGESVVRRPFPGGINPEDRIYIEFERLLRGNTGEAILSGRYIILTRDAGSIVQAFDIIVPATNDDYEHYMSSLSVGLGVLGEGIAHDLP